MGTKQAWHARLFPPFVPTIGDFADVAGRD